MYLLDIDHDESDKINIYDIEAFFNMLPFVYNITELTREQETSLRHADIIERLYRNDINDLKEKIVQLKKEIHLERLKPKSIQASANYTEVLKQKTITKNIQGELDFYKGVINEIEKDIDLEEYVKRYNDSLR